MSLTIKIAVFFCLCALVHARHRGSIGFGASSHGGNIGQVAGFGYSGNVGVGYGTNLFRRRPGYAWQGYAPGYSGGYVGLGGFVGNSGYSGQGVPPILNNIAPNSPYNSGFPGLGAYGTGGPLGSPGYGGYGYSGNGYGSGNIW